MTERGRLVLASHNKKKAAELRSILEPIGFELSTLADFPGAPEPEETGETFAENAAIKAASALAFTGLPALADDSGLEVEALGGAPGVYSARFAGGGGDWANNLLLLEKLAGVPAERRRARFVSVVALARPGEEIRLFRGETSGRILEAPEGENGFGYDPLFLSDDLGVSFAVADGAAKNRISHRARALAQLAELLGGMEFSNRLSSEKTKKTDPPSREHG